MKASDLMIGDWIMYGDKPVQVLQLTADKIYRGFFPIPLTSEILEKNGFVYNAIPFVDGWEQFGLTLYLGGNGYRINCGINRSLIIDFVHELQHALKLCGIDKEITL